MECRLQRIERLDEGFRDRDARRRIMDGGEHVERLRVAVGVLAGGERLRLLPTFAAGDVGEQREQHVGAAPSETPSMSTSRSARPPIGKSGGAASAAITASASAGSLVGKHAEGVADGVVDAGGGEVELSARSFSEPGLLRRVRDRNVASAGHSREHPGAAAGAAVAAAGAGVSLRVLSAGACPSSWRSVLSMRVVLATGHAQVQSLFLQEDGVGIVLATVYPHCPQSCCPIAAIIRSQRTALRQASSGRRAPSPGRATARRRLRCQQAGGADARQQRRHLFGGQRRHAAFERQESRRTGR